MSRITDGRAKGTTPGTGTVRRNVRLECGHTTTRPALVNFPNGRGMHECSACGGRLVRAKERQ